MDEQIQVWGFLDAPEDARYSLRGCVDFEIEVITFIPRGELELYHGEMGRSWHDSVADFPCRDYFPFRDGMLQVGGNPRG